MIEIPSLWTHQEDQLNELRTALTRFDAAILCARAGGGKTRMSKHMIGANLNRPPAEGRSGRCLFAVYGRNLVDNASDSFNDSPRLPHGLIMSGSDTDWQKKVHIASIDTLNSWYVEAGKWNSKLSWDLVVYDECVTGSSIIETELGKMRIDEVPKRKPLFVKSYKDGSVVFEKILRWKRSGNRKTIALHTHHGKIQCTPDHEIFTRRGWLQAKDVLNTDEILVCADVETNQTQESLHAGGIKNASRCENTNEFGRNYTKWLQGANAGADQEYGLSLATLNLGSGLDATQYLKTTPKGMQTTQSLKTLSLLLRKNKLFLEHCLGIVQSHIQTQNQNHHASQAHTEHANLNGRSTSRLFFHDSDPPLEYQKTLAGEKLPFAPAQNAFLALSRLIISLNTKEKNKSLKSGLIQSAILGSLGGLATTDPDPAKACFCIQRDFRTTRTNSLHLGLQKTLERLRSFGIKQRGFRLFQLPAGLRSNWQTSSAVTYRNQCNTNWSRVTSIDPASNSDVFDIEVQNTHCFFANNHLVHNCHAHLPKFKAFIEAHNAYRDTQSMRRCKAIGLSATPAHKDQAKVFQAIVNGPSTEWLIENGKLAPFEYYSGTQGKLGQLIKKGDSYTEESISTAMAGLTGDLVRDWKQYGQGRPTVGFFPRLSHAMEAKELLCENGVIAEYVDGNTSDDERRDLFKWLGSGDIEYLCNVGVVERGTNIPEISCIQLATVVRQRHRLEQMLGRGSRMSPGKDCCRVIDHGASIHGKPDSLGFFEDAYEWTLEAAHAKDKNEGEGERPTIKCPSCQRVYRGGLCTACGYEPKAKELKSQGLEFVAGEMVKLDRSKIKPKSEPAKQSMDALMVSALYAAGARNGTWGQAFAIARAKAEKQGQKFKVPASFDVGGKTYKPVRYGSADSKRRVRDIYDFLERKYS